MYIPYNSYYYYFDYIQLLNTHILLNKNFLLLQFLVIIKWSGNWWVEWVGVLKSEIWGGVGRQTWEVRQGREKERKGTGGTGGGRRKDGDGGTGAWLMWKRHDRH